MAKPQKIKLVTVVVRIHASQKDGLVQLSERTRVPWSEYVREGIDSVLRKYTKRRR